MVTWKKKIRGIKKSIKGGERTIVVTGDKENDSHRLTVTHRDSEWDCGQSLGVRETIGAESLIL